MGHTQYQCSINSKLDYPLVVALLNNKQINSIQNVFHLAVIASKGFNRKWPTALRYGNNIYSGLNMMEFKVEQRVRKKQFIHKMINHPKHHVLLCCQPWIYKDNSLLFQKKYYYFIQDYLTIELEPSVEQKKTNSTIFYYN